MPRRGLPGASGRAGRYLAARKALIESAMPRAASYRQCALVTFTASCALRMFAHSMKTLGTVDRFSPARSLRGWMPPEPDGWTRSGR